MILRDALRAIPRRLQHPLVLGLSLGYLGLIVLSLLLSLIAPNLASGYSPYPAKPPFDANGSYFLVTSAFVGTLALFSLSALPWQWTGDDRPMGAGLRGILQSVLYSLCVWSCFTWIHLSKLPEQMKELDKIAPGNLKSLILVAGLIFNIVIQSTIGFALALWERRRSEKAKAQRQAEEARWTLLKSQMSPHVLLNSLNGLAELVRDDTEAAIKGMRDLAEIYQQLLGLGEAPLVKLSQERVLLERYLAVEKLRLGDRLQVQWNWQSNVDEHLAMPLLLQPLVENAIKHGVAADPKGGCIHITATCEETRLKLVVANTGSAPIPTSRKGTGIGLRNLKARLSMAYKDKARFDLVKEDGWTKAELSLPMEERP